MPFILFHIESFGLFYFAHLQKCQLPLVVGTDIDLSFGSVGGGLQQQKTSAHSQMLDFRAFTSRLPQRRVCS
ncbi:MAG TPA: hypothetical protein DCE56_21975 [Cyanobacteria bacterium UBA8553]|nr:hypothetical protein [Cyanobacteria bacterium UBA8553]HAJ62292.1 hypothetical protein [Cyanobacteria bacterium UBA8543]